ncbi:MAG: hypothetical protein ABSF50_03915 [Burkholderiaceae bacterium]|jgi:hypothetical protein
MSEEETYMLRAQLAGMALQGILANPQSKLVHPHLRAAEALAFAEALITKLDEIPAEPPPEGE